MYAPRSTARPMPYGPDPYSPYTTLPDTSATPPPSQSPGFPSPHSKDFHYPIPPPPSIHHHHQPPPTTPPYPPRQPNPDQLPNSPDVADAPSSEPPGHPQERDGAKALELELGGALSLGNWRRRNPNLDLLQEERDKYLGWRRYLAILSFAFYLFAPVLPMLIAMKRSAWVIACLWAVIVILALMFYEYRCRAELWYICICRGILLDFKKTHKIRLWLFHPVMLVALFFVVACAVIVAIGSHKLSIGMRILRGGLFALGLAFVLNMTRQFICLNAAPRTETSNMTLFFLLDPLLLQGKGFKVVHYTHLSKYIHGLDGVEDFRWDQVFMLPDTAIHFKHSPIWGVKANRYLRKVKDLDH